MALTIFVDPISSPRIITILSPDTSISIQLLLNLIRDWEDDQNNTEYPHLINASGKENLGGGATVGITATLQNAQLAFEARPGPTYAQCEINGGNLVAIDSNGDSINPIFPTAFTQITLAQSSSPTIINSGSSIGGAIWDEQLNDHAEQGTMGHAIKLIKILSQISVSK